ncbi:hypothetical protein RhiirA5_434814 [Rhizophagus irregularis]|uniref:Uncharacterized protein n=1 Tax=Rhizophagus irregularis TaxID=588596 RepID=A0A2N0NPE3_9GLOM|nr:hypothetical protein RhiirA5_434814 [Rhizophagus irregularis]PKC53900.1 hypothetical protein RhiirA1_478341 [Rhizophagus irregularis]
MKFFKGILCIEGYYDSRYTDLNLKVELVKVPAHSDYALNIQADNLAKAVYTSLQLTFPPLALHHAPCILVFNSLPINMNIRHFISTIYRRSSKSLVLLLIGTFHCAWLFDWAGIHLCFFQIKGFTSHKNGRPEFWIFYIKLLLDIASVIFLGCGSLGIPKIS